MATIQNALVCAALALGIWGCIGFAIGSRLLPRPLVLPFAPLFGWAAHSVVVLPLFFGIGMARPTVFAATALSLVAAFACLSMGSARCDEADAEDVRVPALAIVVAGLLACAIASAIIPTVTSDGASLAAPIFDHSKIAMIDDMARLGVPAGNPFFEERGGFPRLVYYYLWHFSAAELSSLTGLSGWEADAGMTFFTSVSSLTLMMGLAVWLSSRASSAFWVLAVAATSSIRDILSWVFGWNIVGNLTGWPTGFGGWLFQVTWAPQHVASAGCVLIAVLLLVRMARQPNWPHALAMALVSAAAFESSTWVGGVTYPLAALAIGAMMVIRMDPRRRWRYILLAIGAAVLAIALSSLFIHDQLRASIIRQLGAPISFVPYEVLGDEIPKAVRVLLDLPAYWTVFLFVEFVAFYPSGLVFAVRLSKEKLSLERMVTIIPFGMLVVVGLGIGSLLVSTMSANNDLAWRGVLPSILALIVFTAAGLGRYLPGMRARYAVPLLAVIALGLVSGARDLYRNLNIAPQASAKRFLNSVQMWNAVRAHSTPGDRVANNPFFLAHMTPWPINISWALLAKRRSCYAGPDLAVPFAPLTPHGQIEVEQSFNRLFSGQISREDVDEMASKFNCTFVVVTPEDGAWSTGPFASDSSYPLVDSRPNAWRIYKIGAPSTK